MGQIIEADCCVVGGGPAGMMAGFLMARAGLRTVVLEKHRDFLRDFRGDTVHPSTMQVMKELGLLDAFLQLPHQRLERLFGQFGDERLEIVSFSGTGLSAPFIALMPQWDFLDFLADQARALPNFTLLMSTTGLDLIREGGRIAGVLARDVEDEIEIRATLTLAADGRDSRLRKKAALAVQEFGVPIDILWFRITKDPAQTETTLFNAGAGGIVVTIDRGDYWQCACVIPKGGAEKIRAEGLDGFRARIARIVPGLSARVGEIESWDAVKLLTVAVNRLETWHRPGFVCIGDAAHAMSPIGGIGINLAIQDAVAAANLFAAPLAAGRLSDADLAELARRRLFPVRATQFVQRTMQERLLSPILGDPDTVPAPPALLRLVSRFGFARRLLARVLGMGVRPEHVRSPVSQRAPPNLASDR